MAPNKRRTGSQKSCQRVEYSSQAQAPADMARECIVVDPDTSDNTNDHAGHDSTLKVESEAFGQVNGLHSPLMVCPEVTAEVCKPTDQDSVLDESTPCPPSPRPYPTHQSPEMVCIQASNGPEPIDKKRVRRESSKKQHSWWYNKNKLRLGQIEPIPSQAIKRQHDGATRRQPAKRSKGNNDMVTSATTLGGGREDSQSDSSISNVASVTVPSDRSQPDHVQQQGSCTSIPTGLYSPLILETGAHTEPPQSNAAPSVPDQSTSHPSVASETHEGQGRAPPSAPFRITSGLGISRSETVGNDCNDAVQRAQQSASTERINTFSPVESGQDNVRVSPTSYRGLPKDATTPTADETTCMPVPCMDPDRADIDPCQPPSGPTVANRQAELANPRKQDLQTMSITSPRLVALNGGPPTHKELRSLLPARLEQSLSMPEELEMANMEVSRLAQELSTAARQQTQALLSERVQLRNMIDTTREERDIALTGMKEWKLIAKSLQDTSSTFAEEREEWLDEKRALGTEKTRIEAVIAAQGSTIQTLQTQAEVAQAKQAEDTGTITDLQCQLKTKVVEAKNLAKQHEDLQSRHAKAKSQNDRLLASAEYFKSMIKENSRLRDERDKARAETARLKTVEQEMQALAKKNMRHKAKDDMLQSRLIQDLDRNQKATQELVDTILEKDRLWSTEREALQLEKASLVSNSQDQVKQLAVLRQQALENEARQVLDADMIRELRTENNGLRSQAQARLTEAETLAQRNQELSEERKQHQLELEEEREKVQTLRGSLAHEETTFACLRLKYEELQGEAKDLHDTFTAVGLKLSDSERSQVRLRTEHTELICKLKSEMEKEKTRHASEVDALERERDKVLAAEHDLGLKLETTVGSLTEQLEAQQSKHATEVLRLQQKNRSMLLKALFWGVCGRQSTKHVVELQRNRVGLQTRVAALEACNHTLKQSLADRDATLAEQIRQSQRLEFRNCRSLLRAAACRYKRRLDAGRIHDLQESCKYLKEWAEESVTSRDNYQGQLELAKQQLQNKGRGLRSEMDVSNGQTLQTQARVEGLEQQLEQGKENSQRLERDLAAANRKIQRLLEEQNVQQTNLEEASNKLTAAEEERYGLKASIEHLCAQVDEKLEEQDRQVESLEKINEQQRHENRILVSGLQHRETRAHELDVRVAELLKEKTDLDEGILRLKTTIKDHATNVASEKARFKTLHGALEKAREICSRACDAHRAQRAQVLASLGDEGYPAQQSMAKAMREYEESMGERGPTDVAFIQDIAILLKGSEGLNTYLTGRLNTPIARASREGQHNDGSQQSRSSGSTGPNQQPPVAAYTPSTLAPQHVAIQPSTTHSPGLPHRPPILEPPILNQRQAERSLDSYKNRRFFCPHETCNWGPSGSRVGFRQGSFLTKHMTAKHGVVNPPKPRAGLPAARYDTPVNQPTPATVGQQEPVHQVMVQQPSPVFRPITRAYELPHINVEAQPSWPAQSIPNDALRSHAFTPGALHGMGNVTAAPQPWGRNPNPGS